MGFFGFFWVGFLMPTLPGSRIPDPKKQRMRGMKKLLFIPSLVAEEKKMDNIQRIIEPFTQKIVTKLSKIWVWDPGSGIQDPGSGKNLFRIPNPGVKMSPGPGSWVRICNIINSPYRVFLAIYLCSMTRAHISM